MHTWQLILMVNQNQLPGRLQILLVLLQEPQPIFKGEKTEKKQKKNTGTILSPELVATCTFPRAPHCWRAAGSGRRGVVVPLDAPPD